MDVDLDVTKGFVDAHVDLDAIEAQLAEIRPSKSVARSSRSKRQGSIERLDLPKMLLLSDHVDASFDQFGP